VSIIAAMPVSCVFARVGTGVLGESGM